MKKFCFVVSFVLIVFALPCPSLAAGRITPSGGGTVSVGQTFTVTVIASGADFDTLQGVISVTGPVSVSSFTAGSATWLPGKAPSNGAQFVGMASATNSLLVATIKLKATAVGSGAVSVSGARMALAGNQVSDAGGSAGFSVVAASSKSSTASPPSSSSLPSSSSSTPTPVVDEKLAKPSEITISKSDKFSADFENGTVTGLIISGTVPANFSADLFFSPELILPKDIVLTAQSGSNGKFTYNIDFPVKTGFYKLQVQGRKDLALTPKSDEIKFELSSTNGGALSVVGASEKKKEFDWSQIYILIVSVIVLTGAIVSIIVRRRRKLASSMNEPIVPSELAPAKESATLITPTAPISSTIPEERVETVAPEANQQNGYDSTNLPN